MVNEVNEEKIPVSWLFRQKEKHLNAAENTNNQALRRLELWKAQEIQELIDDYMSIKVKENFQKNLEIIVMPQKPENILNFNPDSHIPEKPYRAVLTGESRTIFGTPLAQVISFDGSFQWIEVSRIKLANQNQ